VIYTLLARDIWQSWQNLPPDVEPPVGRRTPHHARETLDLALTEAADSRLSDQERAAAKPDPRTWGKRV
jgi:hypothetical protein